MKVFCMIDILKRFKRRRIRWIMRGYSLLKVSGRLSLIKEIKEDLTNAYFKKISGNADELFFGAGTTSAELTVRQYLLNRIGSTNLNEAILYSVGTKGFPIVYPMPRLWQEVVAKHGLPVAKIRCSLLWGMLVAIIWLYGVLSIAKQFFIFLRPIARYRQSALGRYVYFVDLVLNNLPQPCQDGCSYDIISWYYCWKDKADSIDTIVHSVIDAKINCFNNCKVSFSPQAILPLYKAKEIFLFTLWAFKAILFSAWDLLCGHWWHALLLKESSNAAIVRLQDPKELARDYMFHNSNWIYRPLWTYEAEKKGSRIIFYFYSTNCESFKRADGYPVQANSWQVMNWPLYLVWDEYQADFIRRAVGEKMVDIQIVGPIWFSHNAIELPDLPERSVGVFDIQPHRNSSYQILGIAEEYYVPEVINKFLLDVYDVIHECKAVMAFKRKRHIGKMLHPQYVKLLNQLKFNDDILFIDPDISAIRLIESCFAIISMPFTSTALLGRELGKPSVYYDPCGIIQKDDRAAHGIQVLCGKDELRDYLVGL